MARKTKAEMLQEEAERIKEENAKLVKKAEKNFEKEVTSLTNEIQRSSKEAKKLEKAVINAKSLKERTKALENLNKELSNMEDNWDTLREGLEYFGDALQQNNKKLHNAATITNDSAEYILDNFKTMAAGFRESVDEDSKLLEKHLENWRDDIRKSLSFEEDRQEALKKSFKKSMAEQQVNNRKMEEALQKYYKRRTKFGKNRALQELAALKEQSEKSVSIINDALEEFGDTIQDVTGETLEATHKMSMTFEELAQDIDDASSDIEKASSGFMDKLSEMSEALSDFGQAIAVDQIMQSLSDQVDGFIENRRQILSRTGKDFDAGRMSDVISKAMSGVQFSLSRNEMSEVMQQMVKETRIQNMNKLENYLSDIAAMEKAYGTSISDINKLLWQDNNSGQDGRMFRSVSNIAAALEDNANLYTSADSILNAINDKTELIYGVAQGDAKRQKSMLKSVASIQALQESAANIGVSDITEAMQQLTTLGTYQDFVDSDVARQMAMLTGKSIKDIQESVQSGNLEEILMPMYDKLNGLSDNQFYAYSKAYEGLFGSSASMKAFAAQDRDELMGTLNEIRNSIDTGDQYSTIRAAEKATQLTSKLDEFGNKWSDNPIARKLSDWAGELDISMANAAHAAIIAGQLGKFTSWFFKGGFSKILTFGKSLLGKLGGIGQAITGLFTGGAGSAAGSAVGSAAGSTITGGAAGTAAATKAALGKALLTPAVVAPLAGAVGGAALAVDGFKDLVNEESDAAKKSMSGVELAGGTAAAGALGYTAFTAGSAAMGAAATGGAAGAAATGAVAGLGAIPVFGWIALAVAGIAFLGKKAYDNATELSGNAELVKQQSKALKQVYKQENLQRLNRMSDLNKSFEEADTLEAKKLEITKAGLAKNEDLQDMSEKGLQDLVNAYTNAAKTMNSVTDSIASSYEEEVVKQQNVQQKDLIKDLKKQVKKGDLEDEDLYNAMSMMMQGVTDEKLLKKWEKYSKDDKITKSEANDLLYGGKNSWFDKHNLEDQTVDVGAMQGTSTLYGNKNIEFKVADPNAMQAMTELSSKLMYNLSAYRSATDESSKELIKKQTEGFIEGTLKKSEFYEEMKNSPTFQGTFDKVSEIMGIPAFAKGISNLPKDLFALLHQGEAVVTKGQNKALADGGIPVESADKIKEMLKPIVLALDPLRVLRRNSIKDAFSGIGIMSGMAREVSSSFLVPSLQNFFKLEEENNEDESKFRKALKKLLGIDVTDGDPGTSGHGGRGLFGKLMNLVTGGGSGGSGGGSGGGGGSSAIMSGNASSTLNANSIAKEIQHDAVAYNDLGHGTLDDFVQNGGTLSGGSISAEEYLNKDLTNFTPMTVDQMNAWIDEKAAPGSPFRGRGDLFIKASEESGLDPRYILAHAAFESGWGMDEKAVKSNNYFGYGAYDSNVSNMFEYSYGTMDEGIIELSKKIAKGYGGRGQNTLYKMRWDPDNTGYKYASDKNWDTKIAGLMSSAPTGRAPSQNAYSKQDMTTDENVFQPYYSLAGSDTFTRQSVGSDWMQTALAYANAGYAEGKGNNTLFGEWMGANFAPWCASFVSYNLAQAGKTGLKNASVSGLRSQAQELGLYHTKDDGYVPKYGDVFINKSNGASHTGFVLSVNDDGTFTTVEGNSSDKVRINTRRLTDKELSGFIDTGNTAKTDTSKIVASTDDASKLSTYAQGTPFVPDDQVAIIHKGEAVIPAKQNPYNNTLGSGTLTDFGLQSSDYMKNALSWEGFKEALDTRKGEGDNMTPFGAALGMNGQPWCASFVSYMLKNAGIEGLWSASVAGLRSQAEDMGLFRSKEDYIPKYGDVFINTRKGGGHTGFVTGFDGTTFTTIEGNSGDMVRQGSYSIDDDKVVGFISLGHGGSMDLAKLNATASGELSQYEQGTPWIPDDQIAMLHQGEMVVPAEFNPMNNTSNEDITSYIDYTASSMGNDYNGDNVVEAITWMVKTLGNKLDAIANGQNKQAGFPKKQIMQSNSGIIYSL